MTEIHMPRLSDTMEEGVIATWRKRPGETVARGDVVADIETDKAIMELEAYDEGVLERILVEEGHTVPIGTPIGLLGDGSDSVESAVGDLAASSSEADESAAKPETKIQEAASTVSAPDRGKPKASPLAKAVAKDKGVDLASVAGTGPGGRIIRVDIEAASEARSSGEEPSLVSGVQSVASDTTESTVSSSSDGRPDHVESSPSYASSEGKSGSSVDTEEIALNTIRKVTARRLTESKQQAPHIYLTSAIDVTDLIAFRQDLNTRLTSAGGPKISVNDWLLKACATALRANPSLNVSFAGDKLVRHKRIHLGVAVATELGLVVPVIADADRKSLSEIAREGRELAERARESKLKPDEMTGSTFTVSNLGMFGVEHFTAVINPPEAGILAIGAAKEEVRVCDGEFRSRTVLRATLSADHRAVDGAVGAAFLQRLTSLLEEPVRVIA